MDIQDLRIFSRVAALQSLSAAAGELGLTPGAVSKRLQALEEELGARLFHRTTRSIRITEEGRLLVDHARRILDEVDRARASVGANVLAPRGLIKLATPATLARVVVFDAVTSFMRTYPEIEVVVNITDQSVNLQDDGYDVAIRTGEAPESSLISHRLASDHEVLVAAPRYIERHGEPTQSCDLTTHACLVLNEQTTWTLTIEGRQVTARPGGRVRANDSEFLYQSALTGEGIMRVSRLRADDDLRSGRLVMVLPNYEVSPGSAIWAVYPSSRYVMPRLRVLLDFLADWFRYRAGLLLDRPAMIAAASG